MRNLIKVAFLSSVITAALVYVLLEWKPLRSELSRPPEREHARVEGGHDGQDADVQHHHRH